VSTTTSKLFYDLYPVDKPTIARFTNDGTNEQGIVEVFDGALLLI
jgi:hypothetical protein